MPAGYYKGVYFQTLPKATGIEFEIMAGEGCLLLSPPMVGQVITYQKDE